MEKLNDVLGYDLKIYQNDEWFCFSLDSVLLANFPKIKSKTKKILDLGTGNAVIPLVLSLRTKASIYGVDIQPDIIEDFIKELLEEQDEAIEIQRNELAEHFNCVPSQINYVISTRFKPSQGYYVESKRGGGGHITIKKVNNSKEDYIMHIINNVGKELTANEVDILISDFLSYDIINKKEARLLKVATSDNVLQLQKDLKDKVRARIFKNMLLNLE